MSDFISRSALIGYLSRKCAEKDYTTSDMVSDIQRFGIDGEVTPLPKMKKDFEIVANLKNFGGWNFKHYPLTKEEADYVVNALEELKRYRDTGLSVEQLGWIDEEYQELAKKVPRWIPCSERLPEETEYDNPVRIAVKGKGYIDTKRLGCYMAYYYSEERKWHGWGTPITDDEEVIAWQPLPEWEGEL